LLSQGVSFKVIDLATIQAIGQPETITWGIGRTMQSVLWLKCGICVANILKLCCPEVTNSKHEVADIMFIRPGKRLPDGVYNI